MDMHPPSFRRGGTGYAGMTAPEPDAWGVAKHTTHWTVERLSGGPYPVIQYLSSAGKVSANPCRFRSEAAACAALAKA